MQVIQIARGILSTRLAVEALNNGELFLDSTNSSDSYELYVGTPDGKKKIAAEGILSYIKEITTLPVDPVEGGVYLVKADIDTSTDVDPITGINYPEFKAGDFAIYSSRFSENGGWLKISNNGGTAVDVTFNNENTNLTSTNIQQAIVELDRNKLAYGGVLFGEEDAAISTSEVASFTTAEIFDKIKAGYYYSVASIGSADKLKIVTGEGENDYIELEEGDFLSVTSSVTSNGTALTASDIILTKIAGGTHDASKIWLIAGTRNLNAGTTWKSEDEAVKSTQDAVNVLYKSKADLTVNGKIPLAELPDTVIGSVEYQGTYNGGSGDSFVLPTATDKSYYTASGTSEAETTLTKGDYWIYTGSQVNLTTAGLTNVQSSEGYLNTNDWLIYNGVKDDVAQWAVIDNTSPITGISAGDTTLNQNITLTGNIKFVGKNRAVGDASIAETTVVASASDGSITIDTPNAALIQSQGAIGAIYKEAGNKTLASTGLSEVSDTLTIKEKNGIVVTGAENASGAAIGSVNIKQNANQTNDSGKTSIDITLPQASGTLARLEDVNNTISGTHFYLPRFSKPEGSDIASITDSPIEIVRHETDESSNNIKPEGFIYHVNKTLTNGVALADHDVRFRHSTSKVVHMMPAYSGYILNNNSIIDCGEWTADGVTAMIGKYDSYGNVTDKAAYGESLIESWDSLDSVIVDHNATDTDADADADADTSSGDEDTTTPEDTSDTSGS